ncbi:MAG: NAD(P)H:quinone oxidoreductase [Gammaproteobacteria bacterium]|nr:NAD(P)H:quinone oxidoreductase [Gammaproteobacteria bacterium]MBL6998771.1 NAD(P)H:quinone oxidoreductase [Gammaproteobacteria bacterium]
MTNILIVYYSRHGSVARMAQQIALGVESVANCHAEIRCVAEVSSVTEQAQPAIPVSGPPYATLDDLKHCDGLIMGSPAYFGNMASALKHFLDQSSSLWLSGALIGKPAAVFTASSTQHGGQESVLLNMMLPLFHHGMLVSGIPYSESALQQTRSGGTPYGASHVSGAQGQTLSNDEVALCKFQGRQVALLAAKLSG